MSTGPTLATLLTNSRALYAGWREALLPALRLVDSDTETRILLTLDAGELTLEHGESLRVLAEERLDTSALALLRVQHEALLRCAWLFFAAEDRYIRALSAPHTSLTLKEANSLPLAHVLLAQVEASDAPSELKRGLRQFRDESWIGTNSYVHAGLLPLARVGGRHPEASLVQAVQASNAHAYAASMVIAGALMHPQVANSLNLIAVAHPGCLLRT